MVKNYITAIFVVLSALLIIGLLNGPITGNAVKEKVVIYFPNVNDFPNAAEGTVVFDFSFPSGGFRVGNKSADILMFLDSQVIQALKIGYNLQEQKLYAGKPILVSEQVNILDGQIHKVTYGFSISQKKQSLLLDGKLLAEGPFDENAAQDAITGFSIYQRWIAVKSPIEIRAKYSAGLTN